VLDNLKYTENCLLESLRKYSNVPTVVRKAAQDVKLGEYFIPKGATIMVNMQGVHHNPEFWPEPMVYKPERHFGMYKPYTFLPFIDGNRKCLGHLLSRLESKVVLSMLVQNYDFQITNPDEAGLKHAYMIPIIPKNGHHMKVL
jgi:cytochrome P450 family 4